MLRSILMLLALVFQATTAHAQSESYGYVVREVLVDSSNFKPTVKGLLGQKFLEPLKIETFFLVTKDWAEVYAGPKYQITKDLSLSLSGGFKTSGGKFEPRMATSIVASFGDLSIMGILEWDTTGERGLWYKTIATHKVASWGQIGLEGRRFAGFGPHLSVHIPDTKINLWVSWIPWDIESGDVNIERTILGVTVGF